MQINMISYKTEEEKTEIIKLLKEKYKKHTNCRFREISETFILPDKKWIITPDFLIKQLTKRQPEIKVFTTEVIKNALQQNN